MGRRARSGLERPGEVVAARQRRPRHRRHGAPAAPARRLCRFLHGRGNHPVQHGGQSAQRQRTVSNTEAFNHTRFEGPGISAGHSLRGHLHESRITVPAPMAAAPRHLNKHINYAICCAPVPNAESETSLAQPNAMAITRDGATLYVAALGSSKIGVYDTHELEHNTFVPTPPSRLKSAAVARPASSSTATKGGCSS